MVRSRAPDRYCSVACLGSNPRRPRSARARGFASRRLHSSSRRARNNKNAPRPKRTEERFRRVEAAGVSSGSRFRAILARLGRRSARLVGIGTVPLFPTVDASSSASARTRVTASLREAYAGSPTAASTRRTFEAGNNKIAPRPNRAEERFRRVEAAGVEPASATGSGKASTCVDRRLISSLGGQRPAILGTSCLFSRPRPDSMTANQPEFATSQEPPQASCSRNGLL